MNFEYPFMCFESLYIKPSLIIFFLIGAAVTIFSVRTKKYSVRFCNRLELIALRNQGILFLFVYLIIIGSYFFGNVLCVQDSLITPIAVLYLKHDALIAFFILICYMVGMSIIKSNTHMYLNLINRILLVAMNSSLFFALATRQILLTWRNWIVVFVFFLVSIVLLILKFEKSNQCRNKGNTIKFFEPINRYTALFKNNKKNAQKIQAIITSQQEEGICICVSGKWGAGKTSVINGAIDLIKNGEANSKNTKDMLSQYLYIRINALEIDSFDGLFKYFYSNVKSYLKEKGVYTGIESEYQNFITSCIGNLTSNNISELVTARLFNNNENYRDSKEALDKLLCDVLADEKIVVIVDDIERCSIDKMKQFVFFVKEIAAFSKCVSIFATDYDILMKACVNDSIDKDFFDKFFNYRINIADSDIFEMVNYYSEYLNEGEIYNKCLQIDIESSIKFIENSFQICLEKQQQDLQKKGYSEEEEQARARINSRICILNNRINKFKLPLNNPRKMAKLFHVCNIYKKILEEQYKNLLSDIEFQEYAENIKLGKVLFLLSYIEVCMPYTFNKIQSSGVGAYLNEINEHIRSDGSWANHYSLDEEEALFISISIGLLLEEAVVGLRYNYQHIKAQKFLDCLIKEPTELKNIVNGFTTKEQEYYADIENNNLDKYNEQELKEIVSFVVRDFCYKDITQGKEYLEAVFSRMQSKSIAINFVFEKDFIPGLSEDLCVMDVIYNIYFKNSYKKNTYNDLEKTIGIFSEGYGAGKFKIIDNLLRFFDDDKPESIDYSHEQFWLLSGSLEKKIKSFLEEKSQWSSFSDNEDVIKNLIFFSKAIEQRIIDAGFAGYIDFKDHIVRMKNSVEDIKFFLKIQRSISDQNVCAKDNMPSEINQRNINCWIANFNNGVSERNVSDEFAKSVSDFFEEVEYGDIYLNDNNIKELHDFLSKYYKIRRNGIMRYRKILRIKSDEKQQASNEFFEGKSFLL